MRKLLEMLLPRLAVAAAWEYRVQSTTSTPPIKIDAVPVSSDCPFGPQAGITLWPGPSGSVAVPVVGSIVRLGFADASPAKPMIVGLDPANPPTMVFVGEAAGPFAARVGDDVDVTGASAAAPTGIIVTAPSGGGPCVITTGGGPTAYKLTGEIVTGSSKVQVT
jgi:hypothetical protein